MKQDEKYIRECLELARIAEGQVSPNPLVGAIVLDQFGNVVGRGYHSKCGEAHAEIGALNEAGEKAENGTLYVNLEPCSHFGKTPPCINRVLQSKIKRLVVGHQDPNPLVAGNGIKKAMEAGITVKINVLEEECKKINEIFIKHISQKQPFIAIKTASTIDGKIATKTGSSKWITSALARNEVHKLRNKYDAILTGSGTVIKDNPSLTCRLSSDIKLPSCYQENGCSVYKQGRNPIRIVIDSKLITPPESKVYADDGTMVIIATSENVSPDKISLYPDNVKILKCSLINDKIDLKYLVNELYQQNITSILIEAGGLLNGYFIKENLVDKFYFFVAPKLLGDKAASSNIEGFDIEDINKSLQLKFGEIKSFSPDVLIEGYFEVV